MRVELFNRQRGVVLSPGPLQSFAAAAAAKCREYRGGGVSVLEQLPVVETSLVSDRVIAKVHRDFMNIPGPTDVITFPHGEIVIGASVAARQARQNGESTEREIARYIVHGFLHLHGHEDANADDAAAMWQAQEQVLEALWPAAPAASKTTGRDGSPSRP